jgi:hypothetical protein
VSVRLLLIDNYDSFTYNLVQAFLVLGAEVEVHRNDEISVDDIARMKPARMTCRSCRRRWRGSTACRWPPMTAAII